jgi:hypothetical protein
MGISTQSEVMISIIAKTKIQCTCCVGFVTWVRKNKTLTGLDNHAKQDRHL